MLTSFAGTSYPNLREVLEPRYAGLSDEDIEAAFAETFGEGVNPAEYEEFFGSLGRTLGRAAQHAGSFVKAVGPGALQGAATGSALGPWGALGGAIAGGTGAALQRYGGRDVRRVGGLVSGALNTAGSLTGRGALASGLVGMAGQAARGRTGGGLLGQLAGQAGAQGAPATRVLTALLRRPEMLQALSTLHSGRNAAVPVGRARVPVAASAFTGLLGMLARQAEAEWTTGADAAEDADQDERLGQLLGLLVGAEQDDAESDDAESNEYEEHEDYGELDDSVVDEAEFAADFDELVGAP